MKSYEININSNKRAIFIAIILFPISFYSITFIPVDLPKLVDFLIIVILFFGVLYPVTVFSRGKIKIELTKESFRTIWIKRFWLSKEPNIELSWGRIVDYINQEDRGLESFRLTLTNNQQFKFYRLTYYPNHDDFDKFLAQFPNFLKDEVDKYDSDVIQLGKTEYQTKSFKWVLVGLTVLAGGLLLYKIIDSHSGTGWPALGVILSGILFYWMQATGNN